MNILYDLLQKSCFYCSNLQKMEKCWIQAEHKRKKKDYEGNK